MTTWYVRLSADGLQFVLINTTLPFCTFLPYLDECFHYSITIVEHIGFKDEDELPAHIFGYSFIALKKL